MKRVSFLDKASKPWKVFARIMGIRSHPWQVHQWVLMRASAKPSSLVHRINFPIKQKSKVVFFWRISWTSSEIMGMTISADLLMFTYWLLNEDVTVCMGRPTRQSRSILLVTWRVNNRSMRVTTPRW